MTERRDEIVRLLVERLGRHRPRFLSVKQTVAVIRRLIRHAGEGPGECIAWLGAVNNDHYGRLNIRLHGEVFKFYCHRLVDQLAHDPRDIPFYREISHTCDCPPCFHPDHVERVRRPDNRRRSAERTNAKKRGELPRAAEVAREAA